MEDMSGKVQNANTHVLQCQNHEHAHSSHSQFKDWFKGAMEEMSGQKVQKANTLHRICRSSRNVQPNQLGRPARLYVEDSAPTLGIEHHASGHLIVSARSMQTADPLHMSLVKSYVPAATKSLSTALSPTAAVSSATVLTETWLSFRPCSATSEVVVVMTGSLVGVLITIVPGVLGTLGRPLLCAPQLPIPARMMRYLMWSRARVHDALLRREAVAERHECAQALNDPTLAGPIKTPTLRQNMGSFCTNGHAR